MSGEPWNDWYHVNGNTYGTWLRGDPRGWRARHHREHVEGDYKSPPPPGTYDALHARSRKLLTRPPVHLSPLARKVALRAIVTALRFHEIEVIAACVDDHHYHVLARFRDHNPRRWVGIAKKESARELSTQCLAREGGVWAVRCRATPINDRAHQLNVYRYILKHAARGAAAWSFTDEQNDTTSLPGYCGISQGSYHRTPDSPPNFALCRR